MPLRRGAADFGKTPVIADDFDRDCSPVWQNEPLDFNGARCSRLWKVTQSALRHSFVIIIIDASVNQCIEVLMDHRIDAHVARTQFGQIMDRATQNQERFVVDRRGEPSVVIMSVADFIRTVSPPPDWLQKAWSGARQRGLESVTLPEVDAEIAAHRRRKKIGGTTEVM